MAKLLSSVMMSVLEGGEGYDSDGRHDVSSVSDGVRLRFEGVTDGDDEVDILCRFVEYAAKKAWELGRKDQPVGGLWRADEVSEVCMLCRIAENRYIGSSVAIGKKKQKALQRLTGLFQQLKSTTQKTERKTLE